MSLGWLQATAPSSCTTFRNQYLVTLDKDHERGYGAIADKLQYAMELWVARLMTHNLKIPGKTEATLLDEYFAWNHAFDMRSWAPHRWARH